VVNQDVHCEEFKRRIEHKEGKDESEEIGQCIAITSRSAHTEPVAAHLPLPLFTFRPRLSTETNALTEGR
jgi:hypothetical protein